jgi:hypothetical protein
MKSVFQSFKKKQKKLQKDSTGFLVLPVDGFFWMDCSFWQRFLQYLLNKTITAIYPASRFVVSIFMHTCLTLQNLITERKHQS